MAYRYALYDIVNNFYAIECDFSKKDTCQILFDLLFVLFAVLGAETV